MAQKYVDAVLEICVEIEAIDNLCETNVMDIHRMSLEENIADTLHVSHAVSLSIPAKDFLKLTFPHFTYFEPVSRCKTTNAPPRVNPPPSALAPG